MDIVNKLWGFCHTLRHDGVDSGDYIEQLTYLLFLKMSDEKGIKIPSNCTWDSLRTKEGKPLMAHYIKLLQTLKGQSGILGEIFSHPIPRINNPKNLKKIIDLIDEEDWSNLGIDVKGAAFEGLLERAASDGKKGAGQYFTPRILIQAIVNVVQPNPLESNNYSISDPACGTGGFLIVAHEWFIQKYDFEKLDKETKRRIKKSTYYGQELVIRPQRLALMNLFLHDLEPQIKIGDTIYSKSSIILNRFSCILTNPPFGTRGSAEIPERDDFKTKTSNKQLNFIQYVVKALKPGGRAAMVLPDNCLFEDTASEVIRDLVNECNLHTILKLPDGTFSPYAQGIKANVVFFQKGVKTNNVWIYDARSEIPTVSKNRPLTTTNFLEFENSYGKDPNGKSIRKETPRFKRFSIKEIQKNGFKLDFSWVLDDSRKMALNTNSDGIINSVILELESVLNDFKEISQIISAK